jgi:hypothetical protein
MATISITQLPTSTSATGADVLPFVQSGVTKQITVDYLFANRSLTAPALGTPASGTLTNCIGLPVTTGISGLGSGIATFLSTPSSANLKAAVTDETGSGALVFATSPTLVTPALGTVASGNISACTSTGMVLTSPVITGGTIDGTPIGITSASTGKFTTLATNIVTNTNATYTVLATDHTIIQTTAGSTYTLPAASSFTGRRLHIVTQFAGAVISASSNVVPIAGGAAGTAILAATAGKYAILQSNGTNWIIVASN